MLEIQNLTKVYPGGKRAVDGLSLVVRAGEIYGFIGHNGAGKSTTIRAVCGVMDFDGGSIRVAGHDVRAQALEAKRRMAYLPDNPEPYPFMTGAQFISLTADLYGVGARERAARAQRYAALFGMEQSLGELAGAYSHGMKQKLMLIAALVHQPSLLVLDEPFVGLDPEASFHLKEVMRALCAQGSAIFFSTHVLEVAEKLCSRVGILRAGRLIAEGTPEEIGQGRSLEDVFMEETREG
ncbi:MAG: ABC transporter ATP-binding protein [Clostridiales bacterium]|nr:ABC transporter ATP-binding protein [Clostridiales bacterium]